MKINTVLMCHFDLIATGGSVPTYETVPEANRWTISEDGDYCFYAKTSASLPRTEMYSGVVECDKYCERRIEAPVYTTPLTSEITYI